MLPFFRLGHILTLLALLGGISNSQHRLLHGTASVTTPTRGYKMTMEIYLDEARNKVNFTMTGPQGKALAICFDWTTDMNRIYAWEWSPNDATRARQKWYRDKSQESSGSVFPRSQVSSKLVNGVQSVYMERGLTSTNNRDYDFSMSASSLSICYMVGERSSCCDHRGDDLASGVNVPLIDPRIPPIGNNHDYKFIPEQTINPTYNGPAIKTEWGMNKTHITFKVTGPTGRYFSVCFGATMRDADCLAYCKQGSDPESLYDYRMVGLTSADVVLDTKSGGTNDFKDVLIQKGSQVIVSGSRALNTGDSNDHVLDFADAYLILIWALGPSSGGLTMQQHAPTDRNAISLPWQLPDGSGATLPPTASSSPTSPPSIKPQVNNDVLFKYTELVRLSDGMKLAINITRTKIICELEAPSDRWVSIGFAMDPTQPASMVNAEGLVYSSGQSGTAPLQWDDHRFVSYLPESCCPKDLANSSAAIDYTFTRDDVIGSIRKTVFERALDTAKPDDRVIDFRDDQLEIVWAFGPNTNVFSLVNHGLQNAGVYTANLVHGFANTTVMRATTSLNPSESPTPGPTFATLPPDQKLDFKYFDRVDVGTPHYSLSISGVMNRSHITLNITGPSTRWFSFAFGESMARADGLAYTTGTDGLAAETWHDYNITGYLASDCKIDAQNDWITTPSYVIGSVRSVVATRLLQSADPTDMVLSFNDPGVRMIWAVGNRDNNFLMNEHGSTVQERHKISVPWQAANSNKTVTLAPATTRPSASPTTRRPTNTVAPNQFKFIPRTALLNQGGAAGGSKISGMYFSARMDGKVINVTVEGPSDRYFAVAFGRLMHSADGPAYTTGVDENSPLPLGVYDYKYTGQTVADCKLDTTVSSTPPGTNDWTNTVISTSNGTTAFTSTRKLSTPDPGDMQIIFDDPDLDLIWGLAPIATYVMINHGVGDEVRGWHRLPWREAGKTISPTPAPTKIPTETPTTTAEPIGVFKSLDWHEILDGNSDPTGIWFAMNLTRGKNVSIRIGGPENRWFSVGFGRGMTDGDVLVISKGLDGSFPQMTLQDVNLVGYNPTTCCPADIQNWFTIDALRVVDGMLEATMTRPLDPSGQDPADKTLAFGLDEFELIWAKGNSPGATKFGDHGPFKTTRGWWRVNVISGTFAVSSALLSAIASIFTTRDHGIIMFIAWGVLAPLGIFLHRHRWLSMIRRRSPLGYQIHRITLSLVFIVSIGGIIIQFAHLKKFEFSGRLHTVLGWCLFFAVAFQISLKSLVIYMEDNTKYYDYRLAKICCARGVEANTNTLHKLLGVTIFFTAFVVIFTGLQEAGVETNVFVAYVLYLLHIVTLFGAFEIQRCIRGGNKDDPRYIHGHGHKLGESSVVADFSQAIPMSTIETAGEHK